MPGIGLVLNRRARHTRAGGIGEKLAFILGDQGSLCETGSIGDLDNVARLFLDRRIDLLAIGGGDGSNHYTLSAMLQVYGDTPLPRVAFLRGGTHNACANSVGLKGTPESLLSRIVRRYQTGQPFEVVARRMLRVDDGARTHFGFTIATGFLYRFFKEMHEGRHDRPWKVAGLLLSLVGSALAGGARVQEWFKKAPQRIAFGGAPLPWPENNAFSASTMEQVGVGLTPYPRANAEPGKFQAGVFRIRPASFVPILAAFVRGRDARHPDLFQTLTDRVVLQAAGPIEYAFDGDLFAGGPRLEVCCGPGFEVVLV
jgi:diacylglycerol kinase family enzyme